MVLIDLTPRELIDRLNAGKIYKADRIEAALNNFFKIENLAALREVSLRQVAEEVEAKRLTPVAPIREERLTQTAAPQAVGERLLALIKLAADSQRVVRRAFRSAQRLGAELDLLHMVKPGSLREPREGSGARRAAPAGVRARGSCTRRGGRQHRAGRRARRPRARDDIRPDGQAQSPRRPRSAVEAGATL